MYKTMLVHVDGGQQQESRLRAAAALASRRNAGLIVTGIYGHSRFREWILGGTTRELLERAPALLFVAH